MKKVFRILCIICILFSLCGCKTKNNELIEINVYELIDLYNNNAQLLFATVNDNDSKNTEYKDILLKYQKMSGNKVYIVDCTDLTFIEEQYFNVFFDTIPSEPHFYAIKNNDIVFTSEALYSINEIKELVDNVRYPKVDIQKYLDERDNNYGKGIENLSNGLIGYAYENFYLAKPKSEAKEELNNNVFNILNTWQFQEEQNGTCTYLELSFQITDNILFRKSYNGKCKKLNIDKLETEKLYYAIKNNEILIKSSKDGEYAKVYEIKELSNNLKITKDDKEYTLTVEQ